LYGSIIVLEILLDLEFDTSNTVLRLQFVFVFHS